MDDNNVTATASWTTDNGTSQYEEYVVDPVVEAFKILVTCVLAVVMFGMGCAVDRDDLKGTFKRPVGISLGLVCQIFMMPLIAYALIKASSMSELEALLFMSIGCSPGGLVSNIIAMMVDGDMSLSIALTACTNILAFGTVPLWLFLYSLIEKVDEEIQIPYSALGITLASLVGPVLIGILFRFKFPKASKYIAKGSGIFGFILTLIILVAALAHNEIPLIFSVDTLLPILVLPAAGMALSAILSFIPKFNLPMAARKTLVIETSIQNGNLANNLVFLTYSHRLDIFSRLMPIILLYTGVQSIYNIILVFVYKAWQFRKKRLIRKRESDTNCETISYRNMGADLDS